MRVPRQSGPVLRDVYQSLALASGSGLTPSGTNTQCCSNGCQTTYCGIGLRTKGCCSNGNPYVCCIGGSSNCPQEDCQT